MAIRHNYTLLCENVIRDVSGKLSFINVFQNVELDQIPGILAIMFVAVGLTGDPGDSYEISIDSPGKLPALVQLEEKVVERPEAPVKKYQQVSTQIGFAVGALLFVVPGVYHVTVRSKGKVVHRQPFGVFKKDQGDEATNAAAT